MTRDKTWNPLSSSAALEPRSQSAQRAQIIVPQDQHTFPAVIDRPEDLDISQPENSNGDDEPGIQPPNATLNNQGIQQSYGFFINRVPEPDEISQGSSQTLEKAASKNWVDSPVAQQDDNPRKRPSVGNSNLIAHVQEPPISFEAHMTSINSPSNDSTDLRALGGLPSRATESETNRNLGNDHDEGDIEHLSTLLRRLNIQPGTAYHTIVLRTCEEIRERTPPSTEVEEAQRSPVTPASATSSSSETRAESSPRPNRRPHQQFEDGGREQHESKRAKTSQTNHSCENPLLACLFYKVNPHIYATCAEFKGSSISTLGAHLKKKHTGDFHCHKCCRLFTTELQLSAHQSKCRPTGGPCICAILPLSKKQGVGAMERWWETWDKLFPTLQRPLDPWWSENIIVEQINLAIMKRMYEASGCGGTSLNGGVIVEIFNDWGRTPADHLPDLQRLQPEMTKGLTRSDRECPDRVLEAPPRATPMVSENARSLIQAGSQTDRQAHASIRTDRVPNPTIQDESTKRADSNAVDVATQPDPFGTIAFPHGYDMSQHNNSYDINLDIDFDISHILGTEETQTLEPHSSTGYTTDPSLLGEDPHVNAGEMDRFNYNSSGRETTLEEHMAFWANWRPEPGSLDFTL
ncbi:hypothetical protein F5Y14DRAFT_425749 [Nemania sp. NC0429]|nr:hypothetical protein F5Y14DRAFT_425749 [Nemania sp. NC0429]